MRWFKALAILIVGALAGPPVGPAAAERRLALSVGIDKYDNLPTLEQLQKAVNDARAVGATLRELGFETAVEENVAKLAFSRAWQKFLNRLEPGDTAALFFAGHGVEIGGLNYLLPRDVPRVAGGEDKVLAGAAVRLNDLMDDLREKRVGVSLLIVDACRDNPFRDGSGRSVGGTRGLARVEPPRGSFVMYSAAAGEQALDRLPGGADSNPNSVYTRALLPILKAPGLSLQDIATAVREKVVTVARGAGREQTPAYYDQLVGKLVLKPGSTADTKLPAAPQSQSSDAERAWAAAKDSTSIAILEAFRRQYGAGNAFYDRLAEARIEELRKQQLASAAPPAAAKPAISATSTPSAKPAPPAPVTPPAASRPESSGAKFNPRRAAVPLTAAEERALKPKHSFKECGACPEMVVVPSGGFMMGSSQAEIERVVRASYENYSRSEGPPRRVGIERPFAVGKFEVTFAEWDACVAERGCTHRPNDEGWGRGSRPVIDVSWDDITQQYLPWLARKTDKSYRLLTEAEWEYAARGVTSASDPDRRYWWGDSAGREYANYGQDQCCGGFKQGRDQWVNTAPVGQLTPNPFGLHDMHGNVSEWVMDCWNSNYNGAPSDGSAWLAGDCGLRVLRGGSWGDAPERLRSAYRYRYIPNVRSYYLGFRVARAL